MHALKTLPLSVPSLSIVLPAKNEGKSLPPLLASIADLYPSAEIIVVDDGSTDETKSLRIPNNGRLITSPYSMGNGAAIKAGARAASGSVLAFMDADGQHQPQDLARLLEKLQEGYDMVVGARTAGSQANIGRSMANWFYDRLAGWMVGHRVDDLTSGFRVVRTSKFREFIYILPNGFSYPTTITMSFFRAGYPIAYVPIQAQTRNGKSHISPIRDGARFLLIIFRVGTLYSPLKLFVPVSFSFFATGLGYYVYTFLDAGRFTNMSAVLFTTSILIFLIGLVSEQVTNLLYSRRNSSHE
jgi:glycosyltransferase involved in cell wall biosynthesis